MEYEEYSVGALYLPSLIGFTFIFIFTAMLYKALFLLSFGLLNVLFLGIAVMLFFKAYIFYLPFIMIYSLVACFFYKQQFAFLYSLLSAFFLGFVYALTHEVIRHNMDREGIYLGIVFSRTAQSFAIHFGTASAIAALVQCKFLKTLANKNFTGEASEDKAMSK